MRFTDLANAAEEEGFRHSGNNPMVSPRKFLPFSLQGNVLVLASYGYRKTKKLIIIR